MASAASRRDGHVAITVHEHDDAFEFQVCDDGPGIATHELSRIFERYWQATARPEGTGLGLFIAKGIVEAHKGRIWVESTLGIGTTVAFSLPRNV